MSYLTILLLFLFLAISLEIIYRPHIFDSLKERVLWTVAVFTIGVIWDTYAVTHGHWIFPGNDLLGVYMGVLPVEEYLFFLIPPYFAITLATIIREKIR